MSAAAKRCGECRLGLGVHTPSDPYCYLHQPLDDPEDATVGDVLVAVCTAAVGVAIFFAGRYSRRSR